MEKEESQINTNQNQNDNVDKETAKSGKKGPVISRAGIKDVKIIGSCINMILFIILLFI